VADRVPVSLVLTVVLAAVVTAAALAGAAVIGQRAGELPTATASRVSGQPGSVAASGCLVEPCTVLATASVGGTTVDLVVDAGGSPGRLRIGGSSTGQLVETTITELGVRLTADSLQCVAGGPAACLVRGEHAEGVAGQVVVGRSGSWRVLQKPYVSDAGYLVLANIDDDAVPEVVAAQYDCAGSADCSRRPVFAQVFALEGQVLGCTKTYPKVARLPGYPQVQLTEAQLVSCSVR
jgi:hypothetical protein